MAGVDPAGADLPQEDAAGDETAEGRRSADRRRSLSPSRAGDFLTCPLLYRFRVIDRLPEPPSPAAARGTLVHAVLEHLFDRPAPERTPDVARSLLDPEWDRLVTGAPELAQPVHGRDGPGRRGSRRPGPCWTVTSRWRTRGGWNQPIVSCAWKPSSPRGCGCAAISTAWMWRPAVPTRIVDYKTGKAPPAEFEARALFQMKFYALVLWRAQGRLPRLLQLMYLGNGEIVRYEPDEADLRATERKIEALWQAIERARESRDWRPRPGRLCDWCAHKALCPAFGGTPPALPAGGPAARRVRRDGDRGPGPGRRRPLIQADAPVIRQASVGASRGQRGPGPVSGCRACAGCRPRRRGRRPPRGPCSWPA